MGLCFEGVQNTKLGKGEFINMRMFFYNIGCNLIFCLGNGINRFLGLFLEDQRKKEFILSEVEMLKVF